MWVALISALVETFLDKSFYLTNPFPDFEVFQASAVKLTHHGRRSGGVVVLVKKPLMSFVYRVETTYDHIICLKLSSTLLATHSDVLYIAAYVPPIMSLYYTASVGNCHIEQIEHCMLDVFEIHGAMPVIMCGDMNARTGHLRHNWTQTASATLSIIGMTPIVARGPRMTVQQVFLGGIFLSLCFSFELYILNGSCTPESAKLCTYISSYGDSVIDYFAVSSDLLHQATRVVVDERVESEHMPLKLSWLTTEAHRPQAATKTNQPHITKLVWDPHKEEMVKSELNSVFATT